MEIPGVATRPGGGQENQGIDGHLENKSREPSGLRQNSAGNTHGNLENIAIPSHKQTKPVGQPCGRGDLAHDDQKTDTGHHTDRNSRGKQQQQEQEQQQNSTHSTNGIPHNERGTDDGPLHDPHAPEPACRRLVFRIALPVLPSRKVRSEVATMRWVREGIDTPIPVPRVFLYDASVRNAIGYEWILMEHMAGQPYGEVRDSLPLDTKRALARTLAEWAHGLSQHRFDTIGSLYEADGDGDGDTPSRGPLLPQHPSIVQVEPLYGQGSGRPEAAPVRVRMGPLCCQLYTGDWRAEYPVSHGPFSDLSSYCVSLAEMTEREILDDRQHQRARLRHLSLYAAQRKYELGRRPADAQLVQQVADLDAQCTRLRRDLESYPQVPKPHHIPSPSFVGPNQTAAAAPALLARVRPRLIRPDAGFSPFQDSAVAAVAAADDDECLFAADDNDECLLAAVACDSSTYCFSQWDNHMRAIVNLVPLIWCVVPATPLPPRSTVLWHWDMSENNVLVDPATGRPTALLDWEQLYTTPLEIALRGPCGGEDADGSVDVGSWFPLPPLLRLRGCCVSYLEARPNDDDADLLNTWELQEMETAYRDRLRELAVPHSSSPAPPRRPDNPAFVGVGAGGPSSPFAHPEAATPGEEAANKDPLMGRKVMDLVSQYWISPDDVEDLVALYEYG